MSKRECTGCGVSDKPDGRQFWFLKDYYRLNGYFCPTCYHQVSHDPYQKPHDPEGYLAMVLKLGIQNK